MKMIDIAALCEVADLMGKIGLGYILIVNPAIMAWKNVHPLAGIGWVLLTGICLYGKIALRNRYPNIPH